MIPWYEVAMNYDKNNKRRQLSLDEVIDEVIPLLKGKERITIPTFTKLPEWFDGLQKIAPRTLRQK